MSKATGWDTAYEAADNAGGGGRYLSISDGEEYEVVFLGSPIVDKKVWDDELNTYVAYDPDKHERATTKFLCNVYNVTEDAHQVYEFGIMVMKQLRPNFEKRSPSDWSFFISREGKGMNTEYKVILGNDLDEADKKKYADIELYDLEPELAKNNKPPAADAAAPEAGEEVPF